MPTHRCPVAQRLFFFVLVSSPKMESSAIRADSLLPICDTPLRYATVFLLPPFMSPQGKWPPCLRRWGHLHLGWARLCGTSSSIPVVRWPSFCFVQCVLQRINATKSHSRNRGRFKQAIPHVCWLHGKKAFQSLDVLVFLGRLAARGCIEPVLGWDIGLGATFWRILGFLFLGVGLNQREANRSGSPVRQTHLVSFAFPSSNLPL